MTKAKADASHRNKRAARSKTPSQTISQTAPAEATPVSVGEEIAPTDAYLKAFRSVVTPERLRAMAVDLVADFDEQETPLKDKFAVWSRFAAYAIGTPARQAEANDHSRAEEFFMALLDGREPDTNANE